MKLSEGVEWGVHCAVVLAGLAPGATLPGKALAEYHGVSESYLLKHLKALTAAELLVSVPGPRGGYRLARPPERITLLDVVQAIDGTQPAFRCTEIRQRGPLALDARGVTMQYKTQAHLITATYRVSFSVLQGDRFVVVGPSGCGKSTLLKAVGGYLTPTEGEIRLNGERISKPGPDRIMVFQEFDQLLPWMTVFENVVFPLKTTGTLQGKAATERAMHSLCCCPPESDTPLALSLSLTSSHKAARRSAVSTRPSISERESFS